MSYRSQEAHYGTIDDGIPDEPRIAICAVALERDHSAVRVVGS